MFCIYISIWMGLHPIYAAAEAESSRYLDIYILIVCLHFTIFKNDKIHRPLRVKPTVHLLSGAAHCCEQRARGMELCCWLAGSLPAERGPSCFQFAFWHHQWSQTLLLQRVSTVFKKDSFREGDNSLSMHIQSLASLLRLPARMPIRAIQKSPDMLW